jgi:Ca2+-binding EF-hand superfamily protein
MEFNEQAFREKFKELDTEHEGRLDKNLIAQLLRDFDLEQHRASVDNVNPLSRRSSAHSTSTPGGSSS